MHSTHHHPTGLLMGGALADSGKLSVFPETAKRRAIPQKQGRNVAFCSAQRQNRTADTGIFNPGGSPVNVDGSADSGKCWAANGLSLDAEAA